MIDSQDLLITVQYDTRTEAQKHALYELLKDLTFEYPDAHILGHCELPKQRVPIELVVDLLSDGSRHRNLPRVAKACYPVYRCVGYFIPMSI